MSHPIGIYIHIPFCDAKCPYCDFYSKIPTEGIIDRYVKKIIDDMHEFQKKTSAQADTLYIGGGTPSLIGAKRLSQIIKNAIHYFKINDDSEITVELNPGALEKFDFSGLKKSGANRLSIGMQSAIQNELSALGRRHTLQDVIDTVNKAKHCGFDNISLDLMLGIPLQTKESLIESIEFCKRLNIQHISAYLLKIEPGTHYYNIKNQLDLPCEDDVCDNYILMCTELENAGFVQYEISNFSKENKKSKHNLKYWNMDPYIGFGPSAHSFFKSERFYQSASIKGFLKGSDLIYEDNYNIKSGSIEEYIMLRSRLTEGVINSEFKNRFGFNIPDRIFENAKKYQKAGLLDIGPGFIKLNKNGFLLSNEIIANII